MKRFMIIGYFLSAIVTVAWSADAQPLAICDTSTARCTSALLATESTFQYTADAGPTSLSGATDHVASDFGVNRIFASSLDAVVESQFVDVFVMTGGTGSGVMTVTWQLDGHMSIPGASAECSGPTDPDVIENDPGCRMTIRYLGLGAFRSPLSGPIILRNLGGSAGVPVSLTGTFDVPFTYDEPFAGGLALSGNTGETEGTLDFFSTGQVISFILPAGASLQAASGTAYPTEVAAGPAELLQGLIAAVQALNLRRGIANSLDAKLSNAIQALDAIGAGATSSACGLLDAFAQEVRAQAGRAFTDAQAAQLLAASVQIRILLGC